MGGLRVEAPMTAVCLGCEIVGGVPVTTTIARSGYGDTSFDAENHSGTEVPAVPQQLPFERVEGGSQWEVHLAHIADGYPVILQAALILPACFLGGDPDAPRPTIALTPNPESCSASEVVNASACDLRVLRTLTVAVFSSLSDHPCAFDPDLAVISLEPLLVGGALFVRAFNLLLANCPLEYVGPPPVLEVTRMCSYGPSAIHDAGVPKIFLDTWLGNQNPITIVGGEEPLPVLSLRPVTDPLYGTQATEVALKIEFYHSHLSALVLEGLPPSTSSISMHVFWPATIEPMVIEFPVWDALDTGVLDFTAVGAASEPDCMTRILRRRLIVPLSRAQSAELRITCAVDDVAALSSPRFRAWVLHHNILSVVNHDGVAFTGGMSFFP